LLSFPQIHRAHHNNKLYSSQELVTALVVMNCGCGKKAIGLLRWTGVREFRFPRISTGFACSVGFILWQKASTVRQR
jgi:hypothetical protein